MKMEFRDKASVFFLYSTLSSVGFDTACQIVLDLKRDGRKQLNP